MVFHIVAQGYGVALNAQNKDYRSSYIFEPTINAEN